MLISHNPVWDLRLIHEHCPPLKRGCDAPIGARALDGGVFKGRNGRRRQCKQTLDQLAPLNGLISSAARVRFTKLHRFNTTRFLQKSTRGACSTFYQMLSLRLTKLSHGKNLSGINQKLMPLRASCKVASRYIAICLWYEVY